MENRITKNKLAQLNSALFTFRNFCSVENQLSLSPSRGFNRAVTNSLGRTTFGGFNRAGSFFVIRVSISPNVITLEGPVLRGAQAMQTSHFLEYLRNLRPKVQRIEGVIFRLPS